MTETAKITVSGHEISVQCFQINWNVRDKSCPDLAAVQAPISVAEWPITTEQLKAAAETKLDSFDIPAPSRADAIWALELSDHSETHYFRLSTTVEQAEKAQAQGRRAYLRGEIG